jgi:anti-sigma B factor antagonist
MAEVGETLLTLGRLLQESPEERMTSFYIFDDVRVAEESCDDFAVLVVGGEVDYEVSPQLRQRIVHAIRAGRRRLVLDLSDVTFIDSTAIGVLAGAVAKLEDAGGGSLAVVCTHEKVLQIFQITALDRVIALHRSREEAVSALAPAG